MGLVRLWVGVKLMTEDVGVQKLIDRAASRAGIPVTVLQNLLALEEDFPDFTIHGSKTEFSRRIERILDAAVTVEKPSK